MALDEKYFISAPLDQYFVDKDTGLPLCNGTITFFRDSARTTPKAVFQLSGTPANYTYTALTDPVVLSSVGTLQNAGGDNVALYYYPYDSEGNLDLYYVVCENEGGIEQWTREGWPNITSANDPTDDEFPIQNQIANPQFTRVFLNEGITTTYSVSSAVTEFNLAPDWNIEVSNLVGAGSVIVQRIAVTGSANIVTSPPYVLDVEVSAGTTCRLIQRLKVNSGLWASTDDQEIFLAGVMVGTNINVGDAAVNMYYKESSSATGILVAAGSFANGSYSITKSGTLDPIPLSTNGSSSSDGYVEIYLEFAGSTHVRVSSLQVVPTLSNASVASGVNIVPYDAKASNREQALMGSYYIPNLESKQVPSLLTGWDFPLNPTQFGEDHTLGAATAYVWDQTIGLRLTGNVAVTRNAASGGMNLINASASEVFYIMQYLTGGDAKKILTNKMSVNAVAYKGSVGSDVTMRVYMYRTIASYSSCVAVTAAAYANVTYNDVNPGATLTNDGAAGAYVIFPIDGLTPAVGSRVLVKDQAATLQNGVYTVTTVGDAVNINWVLTRATDYDTTAEAIKGAIFPIDFGGDTLSLTSWSQDNTVGTLGTDPITFTQTASVPLVGASIGTVAASGEFTLNAASGQGLNWTEIERNGLGVATATLPTVTASTDLNNNIDTKFSNWQVTDAAEISNTDKFAIVATFVVPTDNTQVTIDSISVTPGNIPCRPGAKSEAESLADCRQYYEKSYELGTAPPVAATPTVPATFTGVKIVTAPLAFTTTGSTNRLMRPNFNLEYVNKHTVPQITIYSPNIVGGATLINKLYMAQSTNGVYSNPFLLNGYLGTSPDWRIDSTTRDRTYMRVIDSNAIANLGVLDFEAVLAYHFVADARLGVV